jgi:hypothetical protein
MTTIVVSNAVSAPRLRATLLHARRLLVRSHDPRSREKQERRHPRGVQTTVASAFPANDQPAPRAPESAPNANTHRDATRPGSFLALAARNFGRELVGLVSDVLSSREPVTRQDPDTGQSLSERASDAAGGTALDLPERYGFTLSVSDIEAWDADHPAPGPAAPPPPVLWLYGGVVYLLDRLYDESRPIERFWFLETVARMPYFSYVTCLHLYETFGWWRAGELRRVHVAEEWNEAHHLLVMESMGGDKRWRDRFLAQHAAVAYYWALVALYFLSPSWSYKFSEMLETHAVGTYRQFVVENEDALSRIPAPDVAVLYYKEGDLYLFDAEGDVVRGAVGGELRRPPCATMLDVFKNILADELEHVKTMALCQEEGVVRQMCTRGVADRAPPGTGATDGEASILAGFSTRLPTTELLEPNERQKWTEWSDRVNRDYGGEWLLW